MQTLALALGYRYGCLVNLDTSCRTNDFRVLTLFFNNREHALVYMNSILLRFSPKVITHGNAALSFSIEEPYSLAAIFELVNFKEFPYMSPEDYLKRITC